MNKKILSLLAPLATLIAFAVVPSMASAVQVQCGSPAAECANGTALKAQSSQALFPTKTLTIRQQNKAGEAGVVFQCMTNTLEGELTQNQGTDAKGKITNGVFGNPCPTDGASGATADITTNASVANPWTVQVQAPDANGQITAHIEGNIAFSQQIQAPIIGDIGSCTYSATNIQLMSAAQSDTFAAEGTHQFTKTAGISLCKEVATLEGEFQLEDGGNNPVVVH